MTQYPPSFNFYVVSLSLQGNMIMVDDGNLVLKVEAVTPQGVQTVAQNS